MQILALFWLQLSCNYSIYQSFWQEMHVFVLCHVKYIWYISISSLVTMLITLTLFLSVCLSTHLSIYLSLSLSQSHTHTHTHTKSQCDPSHTPHISNGHLLKYYFVFSFLLAPVTLITRIHNLNIDVVQEGCSS